MSYGIEIPCPRPPGLPALLNVLGLDDLRGGPDVAAGGNTGDWLANPVQFHRHLVSVRSTEIAFHSASGRLRITVRALPSDEDCDLAVRVARAAAEVVGAERVEPEQRDPVAPHELAKVLDRGWAEAMQRQGARMTLALVDKGGTMGLPGPVRKTYFGPRFAADMRRQEAETGRPVHAQMIQLMRRVQWVHETDGYFPASELVSGGDGADTRMTLAIWQPGARSILPFVDYLVIDEGEGGTVISLRRDDFLRLASELVTPLDEGNVLVEAAPADRLPAIFEEARRNDQTAALRASPGRPTPAPRSDAGPTAPVGRRPWWQFWRA